MLTYKGKEKDRFYFKNFDRANEEELFIEVKSILDEVKDIQFTKYEEIVELDIWYGRYKDIHFKLCLDIDYGPFLICEDESALGKLEEIINGK